MLVVARLRIVIPGNGDHVLGQNAEQLRILHRDVAPEHKLLMIGLKNAAHLLHVLEINSSQADFMGAALRSVRAPVQQSRRRQRAGKVREKAAPDPHT